MLSGSRRGFHPPATRQRWSIPRCRSRPGKVDDADAAKARGLRDKGIAATDIAEMLGVSRATVYRYLAQDAA